MKTKIILGAAIILAYVTFLVLHLSNKDEPVSISSESPTTETSPPVVDDTPTASTKPVPETSMFNLGGEWQGRLQPIHGQHLDPRDWKLPLRFYIRGDRAQVFIDRGGQWQEVKPGKFKVSQHKSNAVIHSIDSGSGWVESWIFSISRRDEDSIFVYGNRIINNFKQPAANKHSRITYAASSVFTRSYERFSKTPEKPSTLTEDDIASQFKEAMERSKRISGLKEHGEFTFYNFKVLSETPGSMTGRIDYHYDGLDEDKVSVGATTFLKGKSTGYWSYRPTKLRRGSNQAIVEVKMSSNAPAEYCSDSLKIQVYVHGKGTFFQQQVPYERCWKKQS